jgi:hypothetical protein
MPDDIQELMNTPLISEDEISDHLTPLKEHWKARIEKAKNASGGDAVVPPADDGEVVVIDGVAYRKI